MRNIINSLKGRYHTHSEAIIISCFFNPTYSQYRLDAFNKFIKTISHMDYRIIECVIGDTRPQLEETDKISRIYTKNLLWHKETLLNKIIRGLPSKYKYVFWVDADVVFSNKKWLVQGVEAMKKGARVIQPFEYCYHLEKNENENNIQIENLKIFAGDDKLRHPNIWRSFCSNIVEDPIHSNSLNYDVHGHVGFAWGAKREILDECPLYEKALIGGADHIIAHAAAGQIPHHCISKSFIEDLDAVNEWSRKFYRIVRGKIGYVKGDLFHIWHGDIKDRQYLKRIQDFTAPSKTITKKDKNGMFINEDIESDDYMKRYYNTREVTKTPLKVKSSTKSPANPKTTIIKHNPTKQKITPKKTYHPTSSPAIHNHTTVTNTDDGFSTSMLLGYASNSPLVGMLGGNPAGAILGAAMNTSEHDNHKHSTSVEHCDIPSHNHVHESIHCTTDHHADTSSNFS